MTRPLDPAQAKRLEMFHAISGERMTRLNLLWVQLEQGLVGPQGMTELMRELHTVKGEASLMGYPQMAATAHALEELLKPQAQGAAPTVELGDVVLRGLDLMTALLDSKSGAERDAAAFVESIRPGSPKVAGQAREPTPSVALDAPPIERTLAPAEGSVRVTSAKLDRMRDIIGELMLTQGRLELSANEFRRARETTREYQEQHAASRSPALHMFRMLSEAVAGIESRLRDDSYRISDLVAELDSAARTLRMVPIRTLFDQYPVAVRDLARALEREVRLELEGEAVEVDRSVLDRLAAPFLHLIRNAVDHGIEPPEVRRRAGKRSEGTVTLRAKLHGRMLEAAVTDDGAGIDTEVVRARATELGLIDAAQARAFTEEQVWRTLFYARMSTRREVTKVSGRGIGLDAVLTYVEALGGTVSVHSVLGQGTTFSMSVPVTLAMTSILLFEVGAAHYAVPAASVVALVEAAVCPLVNSIDGPAVRYSGVPIPLVRLDELIGEPKESGRGERAGQDRLIIVNRGRELLALAGTTRHIEREVVLKSIGKFFERNRLINAAVPLEDGTLALVISISELYGRPRGLRVSPPATPPSSQTRSNKLVLVVDDSPVVRDLLAEALRAHGLRVIEAVDGEDALQKMDQGAEVDLVVTDVDMPRLDGIGLLKRLRQRPKRLPVVIVSMRGSSEDQKRAIDAGADAYLVKTDLSHAGLFTMLARFLG